MDAAAEQAPDAPVGPEPVTFDCGEVVLRGDRWPGADGGPTVLFLHGGGQTRHSWGGTAAALAASGWTATTLDLRGHGESDWAPDGGYRLTEHAGDIRQVIAALTARDGNGPVVVGASLGGLTALTVAGTDAAAVRALVLVDIVPRTHPEGVRRIGAFMRAHLGGFASLDDAADAVAEYTRRPRRRNVDGLRKNLRLRDDGRWYWHWDPRIVQTVPSDEPRPGVDPREVLGMARRVTVPVLVVRGARSDVVDDEGIAELLDAIPTAEAVTVAEAGHMVAGDDNDLFTQAVRGWLEKLGE